MVEKLLFQTVLKLSKAPLDHVDTRKLAKTQKGKTKSPPSARLILSESVALVAHICPDDMALLEKIGEKVVRRTPLRARQERKAAVCP